MILFSFPEQNELANSIRNKFSYEEGKWELREFPDAESYIRVLSNVKDKETAILCSLHKPNDKILPIIFLSSILKEMGANKVGLIAPYLAYMRQDKRFKDGECVTSKPFAKLLSENVDWLVTIDPHLHRYKHLSEIYSIKTSVKHAADHIIAWIKKNINSPIIIGPDEESRQWAEDMALKLGCPYTILKKQRHGDRDVEVSIPDIEIYKDLQPVLIDDIISTAHTMIETVKHLSALKLKPPVCIGIHALFAGNAYEELKYSRVKDIITCNTIKHETNAIDISDLCNAL